MPSMFRPAAVAAFAFALAVPSAFAAVGGDPLVSVGADYVSPPSQPEQFFLDARLRPAVAAWQPGDPIREVPRQFHGEEELQRHPPAAVNPVLLEDADLLTALQRRVVPSATDAFTTPLLNIPGQGYTGVFPPDPSGDVGGGFYVQSINGSGGAVYKIYNTNDGSTAAGPFTMEGLGSGGACASGLGDGIVVYDQLAQRWLLTEFASAGNNLCVYLSANSNPVTTTWTRYVFTTPTFPDYPKYGVWPNAYYVGANEGPAVYALDRVKMLAGQAATLQRKTVPSLNGLGFQLVLPVSFTGTTPPPANAPGLFARDNDDERNSPGSNNPAEDYLELFTMNVNWTTPANTTLTGPIRIAEAEFNSQFNVPSGFGAINQPATTRLLDPLLEVLMYQVYYRNFGDHESIVGNHVTQLPSGGNNAGVRWFELRRTGGLAGSWSVYQQGTYAPADAGGQISRWMAATAMDKAGNIALAYNVARKTPAVFPGLSYTGRLATDALGTMTQAETSIIAGSTSQTNFDRWGDYHQMGVDPDDGCTFWFTAMYEAAGNHWDTRIASFRFDGCANQTSFTLTGTNLSQDVCAATPSATALQPVTITVNPVNGFASPVTMSFPAPGLPAGFGGTYVPGVITPPATTSDANLTVTNAATPGAHDIVLRGSADGVDHDLTLAVNVTTQVPGQVALVSPADNAINQPAQPLFSWAASQQVTNYTIDIATDAGFTDILLSQTLPGGATSFQPSAALEAGRQYWWRVAATNLCGTSTPSAVFTFTVTPPPAPLLAVAPGSLDASVIAGQATSVPLAIGNAGTADLVWTVDTAPADCASPATVAWLSLNPAGGTVHAGDPDATVTVGLDATALAAGTYTANVCVHSNDATNALVAVPVTLDVLTDDTIFRNGFD
ncbi:BACON domain-containing protein [Dokdonella sp.]|uniref:BACON domain-containing protein n=1 Tax=Dokdonella sp. TaxID=2291710 RepID=UPI002F42F7AB